MSFPSFPDLQWPSLPQWTSFSSGSVTQAVYLHTLPHQVCRILRITFGCYLISDLISILAFTFVADIICIDYVRTVIGQTKQGNEESETSDKTTPKVEPYYITCMTITILGAVLAVVSIS